MNIIRQKLKLWTVTVTLLGFPNQTVTHDSYPEITDFLLLHFCQVGLSLALCDPFQCPEPTGKGQAMVRGRRLLWHGAL